MNSCPSYEQRTILTSTLKTISKRHLTALPSFGDLQWRKADAQLVSACAGLITIVLDKNSSRRSSLVSWLTGSSGAGNGDAVGIRRAAIAALSDQKDDLESVLEKSIAQFGDQLYIKHTPVLQQEGIHPVRKYTGLRNLILSLQCTHKCFSLWPVTFTARVLCGCILVSGQEHT